MIGIILGIFPYRVYKIIKVIRKFTKNKKSDRIPDFFNFIILLFEKYKGTIKHKDFISFSMAMRLLNIKNRFTVVSTAGVNT